MFNLFLDHKNFIYENLIINILATHILLLTYRKPGNKQA